MGLRLYVHTALPVPPELCHIVVHGADSRVLWSPHTHCDHVRAPLRPSRWPTRCASVRPSTVLVHLDHVLQSGVGEQQVHSMGHFKQLLISEPCGEERHEKGEVKHRRLPKKIMFLSQSR